MRVMSVPGIVKKKPLSVSNTKSASQRAGRSRSSTIFRNSTYNVVSSESLESAISCVNICSDKANGAEARLNVKHASTDARLPVKHMSTNASPHNKHMSTDASPHNKHMLTDASPSVRQMSTDTRLPVKVMSSDVRLPVKHVSIGSTVPIVGMTQLTKTCKSMDKRSPSRHSQEGDVELSKSAPTYFISSEYPETSPESCCGREQVVQISKCKSPAMQKHVARIMGCRASVKPRKNMYSSDAQTNLHIRECSTQVSSEYLNTAVTQTTSGCLATSSAQTSPNLFPCQGSLRKDAGLQDANVLQCRAKKATKAPSRVGSSKSNTDDTGNQRLSQKLDFQAKAKSRIGSLDNASHKPLGGDKKVYQRKLTFRETATSRIGSLQNINHKPGGGDKQIMYQVVAKRSNPVTAVPGFTNVLAATKIQKRFRHRSVSSDNTTTTRTSLSAVSESHSARQRWSQRSRQHPRLSTNSAITESKGNTP